VQISVCINLIPQQPCPRGRSGLVEFRSNLTLGKGSCYRAAVPLPFSVHETVAEIGHPRFPVTLALLLYNLYCSGLPFCGRGARPCAPTRRALCNNLSRGGVIGLSCPDILLAGIIVVRAPNIQGVEGFSPGKWGALAPYPAPSLPPIDPLDSHHVPVSQHDLARPTIGNGNLHFAGCARVQSQPGEQY